MCIDGTAGVRCPVCRIEFDGTECPVCAVPPGLQKPKMVPHKGVSADFIVISRVRKHARDMGKRVGADFLQALDEFVRRKLTAACHVHNGGKVTLDSAVAGMVGLVSDKSQKAKR